MEIRSLLQSVADSGVLLGAEKNQGRAQIEVPNVDVPLRTGVGLRSLGKVGVLGVGLRCGRHKEGRYLGYCFACGVHAPMFAAMAVKTEG